MIWFWMIGFFVMCVFCLGVNEFWYRQMNKLNDSWEHFCEDMVDDIYRQFGSQVDDIYRQLKAQVDDEQSEVIE